MDLNARHLAFLKEEMTKIKNDRERDGEDRNNAAEILGRVEQDIEWKQHQQIQSDDQTAEIESPLL